MFATLRNPAEAYAKVGIDMRAETASPHMLVQMLFEGAQTAVSMAAEHHRQGKVMEMSRDITKAVNIISDGLLASLDRNSGGELADRLASLYDYMCLRLRSTNYKGDPAVFKEVGGLLKELGGAWEEIGKDSAGVSRNRPAA